MKRRDPVAGVTTHHCQTAVFSDGDDMHMRIEHYRDDSIYGNSFAISISDDETWSESTAGVSADPDAMESIGRRLIEVARQMRSHAAE